MFAPFAEETLKRARVDGGSFEGHPAAVRVPVRVALGLMRERDEKKAPAELWAYVAPGQSREARWQLRDSVSRLSVFAHVPALPPAGGAIVAVDPRGQTHTLVVLSASDARQDLRQTVSTGKFFAGAGEYRLELRAPGTLAASRLTIADDYRQAVINACEPLSVSRKTGPGN